MNVKVKTRRLLRLGRIMNKPVQLVCFEEEADAATQKTLLDAVNGEDRHKLERESRGTCVGFE